MMSGQIVERGAILPSKLQHILESRGGTECNRGAGPLEQRVGGDGGSVDHTSDAVRAGAQGNQCGDHTIALVQGSAQYLARGRRSICIDGDQIGEGSAYIDPDRCRAHPRARRRRRQSPARIARTPAKLANPNQSPTRT